jgi:UDP-N-acetylmuramoylalanine--D-glutamate ligase
MKKYVIYGLGISGLSTAKFLAKNGEKVIATDDSSAGLVQPDLRVTPCDEIQFDAETIISFSPGIPLYFPKPHKILEICRQTSATLACDLEIFYRCNSQNNFIAITGTNGKSTTTALSGFVFQELGIASAIGGNIGVPCFDLPQRPEITYIFETSSYQLDLLSESHFRIAALLNITPDHLERHGSLAAYIAAKKRIFRNQDESDFALIDVDCENSKKVFDELKNDPNFRATLVPISTKKIQENGVALFGEILVNKIRGADVRLPLKSPFLRGEHNDQNMAFAFAIAYCHSILRHPELVEGSNTLRQAQRDKEAKIIAAIKKFTGLRHRLQLLGEIDGIKFVNDSKATNAESSEHALRAYNNIFWILGGRAKAGGISSLTPYFGKIRKAYLIGEATEDFAKILAANSVNFESCGNLQTAFERAFLDAKNIGLLEKCITPLSKPAFGEGVESGSGAKEGVYKDIHDRLSSAPTEQSPLKVGFGNGCILLSPACASLDQWKNFEQRGDYFCELFDAIPKS